MLALVKKQLSRRQTVVGTASLSLAEVRKLGKACDALEENGLNAKALNITRLWILTGCPRQEIVEFK